MRLMAGDLILLMPVRVTKAKNIELAERLLSALKTYDCQPRLVITGPPDPHSDVSRAYYQSLLDLRTSLGLEEEIRFVYELGNDPQSPNIINQRVVSDLLRVSDILFLPSHREGFGMPVLEAGLVGIPIVCSEQVPAANEIGGENVFLFSLDAEPAEIAQMIMDEVANTRSQRFRRQVRQTLTWDYIFERHIQPLLEGKNRD
jgi:glycosyltransferase involved in cell wall biosynthesis